MKKERIYIVPTRFGMMYAGGILVTVLAGTIYTNNIVFMLCFFLVALFLIGMVQTHTNLKGIEVDRLRIHLIKEGSPGQAVIWLKSTNLQDHHLIRIKLIESDSQTDFGLNKVGGRGLSPHNFAVTGRSIGSHQINSLQISTVFPFGMFKAWKSKNLNENYYVYPKPEGNLQLPESIQLQEAQILKSGLKGEDYSQHKKYEIGESQSHVDWKAFARGRPMLVKEFRDGQRDSFEFDINKITGEKVIRLRQISQWIDLCHKNQYNYTLSLNEMVIPENSGEAHKTRCLEALSKYGGESA